MNPAARAFTLVELLTVIAIIIILAGLLIRGAGHAQYAGAVNRTRGEIKQIELALERFKEDNAIYPVSNSKVTDPAPDNNLATNLINFTFGDRTTNNYLDGWRDSQISGAALIDPFGNAFGYCSTSNTLENPNYPGVSIWSSAGSRSKTNKWITNFDPSRP